MRRNEAVGRLKLETDPIKGVRISPRKAAILVQFVHLENLSRSESLNFLPNLNLHTANPRRVSCGVGTWTSTVADTGKEKEKEKRDRGVENRKILGNPIPVHRN